MRFAPEGLFRTRAPWLFEPVLKLHPGAHLLLAAHGARQVEQLVHRPLIVRVSAVLGGQSAR
ncbi:MAG: hypothetical protein ACRDQW_01015 [Haloechinothrix sp.]